MRLQKKSPTFLHRCILGTAGLGGVWGNVSQEESVDSILQSLENGIIAIDTAPAYGDAEFFIGKALQQWKGRMPQISTKVGRLKSYATDECFYDYSSEGMQKSVESSLNVLGLPVIDTLFLHEPSVIEEDDADRIIEVMLLLKQKGYAKRLGVGGNSPGWFKKYITLNLFEVVMEYNRLNACNLDASHTSLPDCESKGIAFYVASPLHMGLLGSRFDSFTANPPVWLDKNVIETAKRVKAIADRYGLSLPSLAHRFLLSLPNDFKIVIGAVDSYQLQQSINDFAEGPLPCELFDEIMALINVNG